MSNILRMSTEHITAPLADEGNYAYCQSRGAHNINGIAKYRTSKLFCNMFVVEKEAQV